MSLISESVTSKRVIFVMDHTFGASETEVGEPVDTAGLKGLFFIFCVPTRTNGIVTFTIEHCDTMAGTYEEIGQENLVYGRNDGKLPRLTTVQSLDAFIPREGVVGTKRWVRVTGDSDGDGSNMRVLCYAVGDVTELPSGSDASYAP